MPPHAAPRRPQPPRRLPRRRDVRQRRSAKDKGGDKAKADDKNASNISSKIRSLLVGASVVVIVLGTFKMAMTLLDTGSVLQLPMMESSEPAAPAQAPAPAESSARPAMPAAPGALDDLADAGREAVEQFFRTEHAG